MLETFPLELVKLRQTVYKSDFVVYDKVGSIKHVYDVKNGYTEYAIDQKSKIKFSLFARKYGIPVEVVVMRKNYSMSPFWAPRKSQASADGQH